MHMFKCYLCEVKFIKDSELKEYIHKCHRTKCDICNAILGNFVDLQSHKKKFHGSELKTPAECLCGICEPEEITSCNYCSRIFKCYDDCSSHKSLQHEITCEICSNMNPYGSLWSNEAQFYQHNKEYHGSNLKPPEEANDDKHEEEVDETSTDEEHTDDVTLFEKPLIPTRPNEEIETYSVLSKAVYIEDVESPEVNKLAKLSPRVEIKGRKQQSDKEENGSDHEGKMRKKIVGKVKRKIQRKEMFSAKLWKVLMI